MFARRENKKFVLFEILQWALGFPDDLYNIPWKYFQYFVLFSKSRKGETVPLMVQFDIHSESIIYGVSKCLRTANLAWLSCLSNIYTSSIRWRSLLHDVKGKSKVWHLKWALYQLSFYTIYVRRNSLFSRSGAKVQ